MRLADNEIRDIRKYLESGKPLPDFYRFLLFEEKQEVELVWNGKTNEVCNIVLPFQIIEHVDEPRSEKNLKMQMDLFDERGRQLKGWTNKLIWGDNKLILSSLKNGPLREEIEKNGGIKLIYIDPPFDVGADFSMNIEIGDEQFTKAPSVLEELAYRDTWGKGADSFIVMIYERLSLMRDLLADDGSIYVHCDWRLNSYMRLVLDEIFDKNQVVFHDVSYIEVKPIIKKNSVAIELTDFSVFYNQDTIANVEASLKNGGSKIYVENGKIIKVTKSAIGIVNREVLTKKWTDWIDYWAIDFDFESKKEVIRVKKEDGSNEEVWTGDYVFENEWQSFRTKKDRTLELKSVFHECLKGRRKVAVKVVDIFGNDTMKIIEVNI